MIMYQAMKIFVLSLCLQFGLVSAAGFDGTINLVWQFDQQYRCEEDWLMEVLSGVGVNVVSDGNYEIFLDNSVVIISSLIGQDRHKAYFEKLRAMNYHFGIIHLSDETYAAATDFYAYADFVFRSYWHKKFLAMDNVWILPLGYKAGFWRDEGHPQPGPAEGRKHSWCFAGQIGGKPTRMSMIENLKSVCPYYIYETFAWGSNDPNALGVLAYRDMMLDTIFVPSPTGWWNLDSFRLCEALECGCIPIVERQPIDYFGKFFGDHPFMVVDSWDQAPALMNALINDPVGLEWRRQQCCDWWNGYKNQLKHNAAGIIYEKFLD